MTAGSLGLAIGELQRVTAQLEDTLREAPEYAPRERAAVAGELSDLAVRLELARLEVLDPGADDPVGGP